MTVTKQVALLRGINLGRNRRIAMSDLRSLVHGLGYPDAVTHLQSGNIVFTAAAGSRVAGELEREIAEKFEMKVDVIVRTRDELAAVVENNPMPERTGDPTKFAVTFLASRPKPAQLPDPAAVAPDEFRVLGREIYLWLPNGFQGSKLGNGPDLGITATTRNWRTVLKLLELASAG